MHGHEIVQYVKGTYCPPEFDPWVPPRRREAIPTSYPMTDHDHAMEQINTRTTNAKSKEISHMVPSEPKPEQKKTRNIISTRNAESLPVTDPTNIHKQPNF